MQVKTPLAWAIIVIFGLVLGGIYLHSHSAKTKAPPTVSHAGSIKAGWKTYQLKYEKLDFQYPTEWQLKDTSRNGQDIITLTGANNFVGHVQSGVIQRPLVDPAAKILYTQPTELDKQPVYDVYLSNPQNVNLVSQIYVSKSKTDAYDAPSARNTEGVLSITAGYASRNPGESLRDTANDTNYRNANLILASMHY